MTEEIYSRRSIRKYTDKEISRNDIDAILDAGRVAPSAKNSQPWRFIVLTGNSKAELCSAMERGLENEEINPKLPAVKAGLGSAKQTLKIMQSAPVIVAVENVCGKHPLGKVEDIVHGSETMDLLSIGACVENMLLKATELGIGSLWIGNTIFAYDEVCEYLGIETQLACVLAFGYAENQPNARPRKELCEIVKYMD